MATKTTPPDNKMRLAALDQIDDRVLYIEGAITDAGIIDASTIVVALRDVLVVDEQGGCVSLACNTAGTDYHVAWLEYDPTYTYQRIVYCKSSTSGSTWGTPIEIATVPSEDDYFYCVRIMGDSAGRLFILFQHEDDDGVGGDAYQVRLYRSLDGGDTWTLIQTFQYADYYCDIQIDGSDNIYVFYWSDDSGDHVCRKSTDNGTTFGAEVTVVSSPGSSDLKAELDDSDNIHVIYEGWYRTPFHTKSIDGGAGFSAGVQIAEQWRRWAFPGIVPWFTIDGSDIHFVWAADTPTGTPPGKLMYSHSPDGGTNWSLSILTDFTGTVGYGKDLEPNEQGSQCLLYDGSTLLYVFGDNHYPGTFDYLGGMTSGDGGLTWTQASIVDYGKHNHWHPSLATYFTAAIARRGGVQFILG